MAEIFTFPAGRTREGRQAAADTDAERHRQLREQVLLDALDFLDGQSKALEEGRIVRVLGRILDDLVERIGPTATGDCLFAMSRARNIPIQPDHDLE